MKKLFIAAALVLGMGSVAFAQSVNTNEVQTVVSVNDFTPIEVKDLPQEVQDAIAANYPEATIKEAAMQKNEDETVTYQITLTAADGTEVVALFNEKGEELK